METELNNWQLALRDLDRLIGDIDLALRADSGELETNDDGDLIDDNGDVIDRDDLPRSEDALSVDVQTRYQITLSLGGPTVWVELIYNRGEYVRGEYVTNNNDSDSGSRELIRVDLAEPNAERIAKIYLGVDLSEVPAYYTPV